MSGYCGTPLSGKVGVKLPTGLVDTKACAIDEMWPGLRLVARREPRQA